MVRIEESWQRILAPEFEKEYFGILIERVRQAYTTGRIYPKGKDIFAAFDLCPFDKVKVVILGQDPYHGPGQAHGLSFSVQDGVAIPPSLRNIYKELSDDMGVAYSPTSGNLTHWARQGVLLLNASLTVEEHRPMSHSTIGWHIFTDNVIRAISKEKEHVVFILWGSFAGSKRGLIDETKHLVLSSAHPSPMSVHRGFFGSKPFSKANYFLFAHGLAPIQWIME